MRRLRVRDAMWLVLALALASGWAADRRRAADRAARARFNFEVAERWLVEDGARIAALSGERDALRAGLDAAGRRCERCGAGAAD